MAEFRPAQNAFSRFEDWSAAASVLVLTIIFVLVAYTANLASVEVNASPVAAVHASDADLYQSIINGVASGRGYYTVAVQEHRQGHFPLKPFFTVRAPLLAIISAILGPVFSKLLLFSLISAVAVAWWQKLRSTGISAPYWFVAAILIAFSSLLLSVPRLPLFHESWTGLLIALSIALRTPEKYFAAIAVGLVAALLRELATAYLCLMLVCAFAGRNYRESVGWALAIATVAVFLALHSQILAQFVVADDLISQGWNGMGGWQFYVDTIRNTSGLIFLPATLGQALVPLCLFGWLSLKSADGIRVAGVLTGYALMVMLFARPANLYWSLLCAPLMLAGLVFAAFSIKILLDNVFARQVES